MERRRGGMPGGGPRRATRRRRQREKKKGGRSKAARARRAGQAREDAGARHRMHTRASAPHSADELCEGRTNGPLLLADCGVAGGRGARPPSHLTEQSRFPTARRDGPGARLPPEGTRWENEKGGEETRQGVGNLPVLRAAAATTPRTSGRKTWRGSLTTLPRRAPSWRGDGARDPKAGCRAGGEGINKRQPPHVPRARGGADDCPCSCTCTQPVAPDEGDA
jgi:hypothetical protein